MSVRNSLILGVGGYLPDNILTNDDLSKIMDTNDAWITSRTGIKKRHIAPSDALTSDLATNAAKIAIDNAGIKPNDIDAIIVATTTADYHFPATATKVQANLNITNAFAFDVQAVCAGFIYAITVADSLIKSGSANHVLVIGAETMSKIVNWQDRTTSILFGDGAGAMVLKAVDDEKVGIISIDLNSDGNYIDILKTTGGIGVGNLSENYITMKGGEVFKHAVEKMHRSVLKTMNKLNLTIDDIDLFIPHQANIRIIEYLRDKLSFPTEKVIITVDKHANTSAASIPLAYYEAFKAGRIKKGQKIMLTAIGGGLSWGSVLVSI